MIGKKLTAALAALSMALAPAPLFAQADPAQPVPGPTPAFSLPDVETFRLANGMQVTMVPYGVAPKVSISLRIEAGNVNEGENTWLADLMGSMLTEGAGGRSGADIAGAAASMGGQLGANVGVHETNVGIDVLSEHAADAVRLVADVATRPNFPAAEFDRVKQNLARGRAVALSQPGAVAEAVLARAYYGAHPYGRLFPSEQQLAGYTLDQVRQFHAANFGARRARLYIAGRFDAAAVRAAVEQAFSGWMAGPERLSLPPRPTRGPQLLLVNRPGAPQTTMRIAFPAANAGGEGDIQARVMNALLGGSFTSRITQNIREAKGYTYSPGSGIRFRPDDALWVFQADVTTNDTGAALREVFNEVKRLQSEAPPAEEAGGMATWLGGTFILQNATSGGLINSLATRDLLGLPANWLETYVPAVLAVDAAQIQRSAARMLPLERMTLVLVGDLPTIQQQIATLPELQGIEVKVADPL
jgi:zinc protease